MSDGTSISPEVDLKQEAGSQETSLYKSPRFEVLVPQRPNIPINEGLHVQVSSGHDESDSPKQVLARHLMAEGVAKILAESGVTQDAWANTRLEQGQIVSVYGRVPEVENSWRKPVDTFQRGVGVTTTLEPYYDNLKLQELCQRYLPKWEQLANNIELFKNGVNGKDINAVSNEFVTVWENDKIKLQVIINPHLKGLHLIASPKEGFQRQWQAVGNLESQPYIEATLEVTAVAMGVQKLLADGRGEIHNSGNWASDLRSIEEGGKLDLGKLSKNRKAEKRSHRPDIAAFENQFNTEMHVHVYIPSGDRVILSEMSKQEAIEKGREDVIKQWQEIPSMNQIQLEKIRAKLGKGKLTKWLEENCKGQI